MNKQTKSQNSKQNGIQLQSPSILLQKNYYLP